MVDHQLRQVGSELDVAELAARHACQDVIVASFALADARRRADIADLFVKDGALCIDGTWAEGTDQIRSVLAARDADPDRRTAHVVAAMNFVGSAGNEIRVRCLVALHLLSPRNIDPLVPSALTSVDDCLVKQGNTWRFSSREISMLAGRS